MILKSLVDTEMNAPAWSESLSVVLPRFWRRLDSRYIAFPLGFLRLPSHFLDYVHVSIMSIASIIMFMVSIFACFSCSFAHVSSFVPFTSSHIIWPSLAFLHIPSHSITFHPFWLRPVSINS